MLPPITISLQLITCAECANPVAHYRNGMCKRCFEIKEERALRTDTRIEIAKPPEGFSPLNINT